MNELYLISRFDAIRFVSFFILLFGGVLNMVNIFMVVCSVENEPYLKRFTIWLTLCLVLCILILVFLPSTEEALILAGYE